MQQSQVQMRQLKCYPLILQGQERKCDAMSGFNLHTMQLDELHQAMENFQGNTEEIINEVLHNDGGQLLPAAIQRLMPVSDVKPWKGKKPNAKNSNSLMQVNENLSVTIKSKKAYQYLYFPDDGSSTKRHAGNQQFFRRGGESQKDEIIDRCIGRLVGDFEG